MDYRQDLWEIAASRNGLVTVAEAEDAGVPAVEVLKSAARGALRGYGQGVYTHRDVLKTSFAAPTVAVALAGEEAFLNRESVLDLFGLGQLNPPKANVGARRRVWRRLPDWIAPDPGEALVVQSLRRELIGERSIDARRGLQLEASVGVGSTSLDWSG